MGHPILMRGSRLPSKMLGMSASCSRSLPFPKWSRGVTSGANREPSCMDSRDGGGSRFLLWGEPGVRRVWSFCFLEAVQPQAFQRCWVRPRVGRGRSRSQNGQEALLQGRTESRVVWTVGMAEAHASCCGVNLAFAGFGLFVFLEAVQPQTGTGLALSPASSPTLSSDSSTGARPTPRWPASPQTAPRRRCFRAPRASNRPPREDPATAQTYPASAPRPCQNKSKSARSQRSNPGSIRSRTPPAPHTLPTARAKFPTLNGECAARPPPPIRTVQHGARWRTPEAEPPKRDKKADCSQKQPPPRPIRNALVQNPPRPRHVQQHQHHRGARRHKRQKNPRRCPMHYHHSDRIRPASVSCSSTSIVPLHTTIAIAHNNKDQQNPDRGNVHKPPFVLQGHRMPPPL